MRLGEGYAAHHLFLYPNLQKELGSFATWILMGPNTRTKKIPSPLRGRVRVRVNH